MHIHSTVHHSTGDVNGGIMFEAYISDSQQSEKGGFICAWFQNGYLGGHERV